MIQLITMGLGKLFGMGETWVEAKQERETAKVKGQIALETAKVNSKITILENDAVMSNNIDLITVKNKNNTIMDNVVVFVFLTPFVLMFVPYFQEHVASGFAFFKENTPDWYKYVIYGIIISELGLRRIAMKLFDTLMTIRTGKLKD